MSKVSITTTMLALLACSSIQLSGCVPLPMLQLYNKNLSQSQSRIDLRVMQSRKFLKYPNEVMSAIESLVKDRNGQCPNLSFLSNSGISQSQQIAAQELASQQVAAIAALSASMKGIASKNTATTMSSASNSSVTSQSAASPTSESSAYTGSSPATEFTCNFDVHNDLPSSSADLMGMLMVPPPTSAGYERFNTMAKVTYEVRSPQGKKETVVRMRVYLNGKQSESPELYNKLFKELADGLFIDAIQLNPGIVE